MNRRLMTILGVALVALMVFGGAGTALAKAKPHPKKSGPGVGVVKRYTKMSTLVTSLGEISGVPTADIRAAQKKKGVTLASVATSYGVDPQAVVDKSVAKVKVKLDELVARQKIGQAREDRLLAQAKARFEYLMFSPRPRHMPDLGERCSMRFATMSSLVRNLAALASVPTSEVASARRAGNSLASIATSLGVDPAAVVDRTLTGLKARLEKLVSRGCITQARADAILARTKKRLERLMNFVPPAWAPVVPAPPAPSTDPTPTPLPAPSS